MSQMNIINDTIFIYDIFVRLLCMKIISIRISKAVRIHAITVNNIDSDIFRIF